MLDRVARVDRLPPENTLEALYTLRDCWDHVDLFTKISRWNKRLSKYGYILTLLIGNAQ